MERKNLVNTVKLVGELVSKQVRRSNEGTADETLSLEVVVRTGETEEHTVSFFSYKYGKNESGRREKRDDKISKLFQGYETVVREFKAMDDENGDGTGEKIEIKGSLSKNMYVDKSEQLKEFMKIKGTFCSRVKDVSKYTPCAVWSAHIYITNVEEEIKDVTGEYTRVKGIVVDYVEDEFEFRIYHPNVVKGFSRIYSEGDAALFKGYIVNRPDEAEKVEDEVDDDSFGIDMDVEADSSNTIRRRYLEIVKGDSRPMDNDDEEHPLSDENIAKYKKNINNRKSDIIAKHEEKQKNDKNTNKIDPNAGVDDLMDIPF